MRTPSALQRWKRPEIRVPCGAPPFGQFRRGSSAGFRTGRRVGPASPRPLEPCGSRGPWPVDGSGNDCVDDLLECARLRRAARSGFLELDHLGADLLQVLAAQAFSDLREPVLLFLVPVSYTHLRAHE